MITYLGLNSYFYCIVLYEYLKKKQLYSLKYLANNRNDDNRGLCYMTSKIYANFSRFLNATSVVYIILQNSQSHQQSNFVVTVAHFLWAVMPTLVSMPFRAQLGCPQLIPSATLSTFVASFVSLLKLLYQNISIEIKGSVIFVLDNKN